MKGLWASPINARFILFSYDKVLEVNHYRGAECKHPSFLGVMIKFSKEGMAPLFYKREFLCSGEKGLELKASHAYPLQRRGQQSVIYT